MKSNQGPSRPVTTIKTAFRILQELKGENWCTLGELATDLPYSKSTVHRHVETLVSAGYVDRQDDQYRLSLRFLEMGTQARRAREIFHVSKDYVDSLATETDELVWCVVEENGKAVHIYGNSGNQPVKSKISIGEYNYLHQLAAGKAILAYLPDEEIDQIIEEHGLPKQTENTITTRDALDTELEEIRTQQVAFNREESSRHVHAVGVPIRDEEGIAMGSLSISGPARRLKGDTFEEEIPELLLEVTNEIEIEILYN